MPYRSMTDAQVRAFLTALPARTGQVGHGARRRTAARGAGLVRRRRRRLAGLQHGRVDGEGSEPAAGSAGVALRGRRSAAVQLRGGGGRRRDQRRPRRGAPVGRPGSAGATWAPSGPRSTGPATAWRASWWCGCAPNASCRRSIWPTETSASAAGRRAEGRRRVRSWRRRRRPAEHARRQARQAGPAARR